jgi:hypothetical protein
MIGELHHSKGALGLPGTGLPVVEAFTAEEGKKDASLAQDQAFLFFQQLDLMLLLP